jgi:predicted nuclease with TOPRIM domain
MPTDENTRLRIRQYFVEQIDEQAADAIMESMPPVPWTELATKSDLRDLETRLDERFEHIDERFDLMSGRFEQVNERFDLMNGQFEQVNERFDLTGGQFQLLGERFDHLAAQFDGLGDQVANQLVGFEGTLDARYAEAVRLTIFAVVSLMLGLITAVIAVVGLG